MIRASIFINDEYDTETETTVEAVVTTSADAADDNPYIIHIRQPLGRDGPSGAVDLTIHLGEAAASKLYRDLGEVLS